MKDLHSAKEAGRCASSKCGWAASQKAVTSPASRARVSALVLEQHVSQSRLQPLFGLKGRPPGQLALVAVQSQRQLLGSGVPDASNERL